MKTFFEAPYSYIHLADSLQVLSQHSMRRMAKNLNSLKETSKLAHTDVAHI